MKAHTMVFLNLLVWLLMRCIVGAMMTGHGIHDPVIIGHRGSAEGVENTLEAIQAIDTRTGLVEPGPLFDIYLTGGNR